MREDYKRFWKFVNSEENEKRYEGFPSICFSIKDDADWKSIIEIMESDIPDEERIPQAAEEYFKKLKETTQEWEEAWEREKEEKYKDATEEQLDAYKAFFCYCRWCREDEKSKKLTKEEKLKDFSPEEPDIFV